MADPRGNRIFYTGQSMFPLLREGDDIEFRPFTDRAVQKGDVVVFSPPGEERYIIHRVIEVGPEGIRTRGDANGKADPWFLKTGDLLGRVLRFRRGEKDRTVAGGLGGVLQSAALRCLTLLRVCIIREVDPVVQSGFYSGALAGWVPKRYRPRVLAINRAEGTELMLVMGKQVVGRRFAGNGFWQIRRRFRPFIPSTFFSSPLPPSAGPPSC